MPVMATTFARQRPIMAPAIRAMTRRIKPREVDAFHSPESVNQTVATMAMAMPAIP